jgi:hypothetical protein
MTAIFISHSSVDNAEAEKMKTWLKQQGHQSLFLDFDPEEGIRAGGDWEQILYRRLRQCQAVIILLTPGWLASKWCFAEMVQAREKGKAIFPVKVKKCDADGVLAQIRGRLPASCLRSQRARRRHFRMGWHTSALSWPVGAGRR